MTTPLHSISAGVVIRPYIHTRPFALFLWLLINLASFGFEFKQWRQRRVEATKTDRGSLALLMTSAEQPVITSGPYRFVRHPGYTGVLLILLGAGLVTGNWIGLAGWTLLVTIPLLYRIHVEENALLAAVGDRYRTYASAHKRLIPLVW